MGDRFISRAVRAAQPGQNYIGVLGDLLAMLGVQVVAVLGLFATGPRVADVLAAGSDARGALACGEPRPSKSVSSVS
jgi:hypothetical protein